MKLTVGHLYADLMNVYADRGNIISLRRRCEWRGIELAVEAIGLGEPPDRLSGVDLLFIGGGQDREQKMVAADFEATGKAEAVRQAIADGLPALAVCGGYQLFARYYRPAEGPDLPGIGVFDAVTVHKGANVPRCIGNVVVEWDGSTLVGFENHGGRTYLGSGCRPLGKVVVGFGNNAEDGWEGAVVGSAYGTYLHGSLLPKNPHFADHLIRLALSRRYGSVDLPPLADDLEWQAPDAAFRRGERGR